MHHAQYHAQHHKHPKQVTLLEIHLFGLRAVVVADSNACLQRQPVHLQVANTTPSLCCHLCPSQNTAELGCPFVRNTVRISPACKVTVGEEVPHTHRRNRHHVLLHKNRMTRTPASARGWPPPSCGAQYCINAHVDPTEGALSRTAAAPRGRARARTHAACLAA